jgi:hypothetical protein
VNNANRRANQNAIAAARAAQNISQTAG